MRVALGFEIYVDTQNAFVFLVRESIVVPVGATWPIVVGKPLNPSSSALFPRKLAVVFEDPNIRLIVVDDGKPH
jgi:hypothetical protein